MAMFLINLRWSSRLVRSVLRDGRQFSLDGMMDNVLERAGRRHDERAWHVLCSAF
jgi:hypothetical protein